jgi:transcriptional regulator with XRE-family HTH domain
MAERGSAIKPSGEIERLIGARFREVRRGAGISLEQMASEMNRVINWLRNHEQGSHIMRMEDAVLAAHVLGVAPADLFPSLDGIDTRRAFETIRAKRTKRPRKD